MILLRYYFLSIFCVCFSVCDSMWFSIVHPLWKKTSNRDLERQAANKQKHTYKKMYVAVIYLHLMLFLFVWQPSNGLVQRLQVIWIEKALTIFTIFLCKCISVLFCWKTENLVEKKTLHAKEVLWWSVSGKFWVAICYTLMCSNVDMTNELTCTWLLSKSVFL